MSKLNKPRGATHVRISSGKKTALVDVKDIDCIAGVSGEITWLKGSEKKGFAELAKEDFDGEYEP